MTITSTLRCCGRVEEWDPALVAEYQRLGTWPEVAQRFEDTPCDDCYAAIQEAEAIDANRS